MTDATVATSTDLEDPDAIDLDRLGASLDHLHAHFCQASADAAPSLSEVGEPFVLAGSAGGPCLDGLCGSTVLLDPARSLVVAKEAA